MVQLLVTCGALSSPTLCGFIPALSQRPLAILLKTICICLVVLLASCETREIPSANKSRKNENVLRYDVNAPFTSLNPAEVYSSGSNHVFPLLYSYLFVPGSDGRLQPDLAVKWTYDAESFTWTIHLREGALFHNRQPVTAMDVAYSLQEVLRNIHPPLCDLIGHISTFSDNGIRIRLKKHHPEFLRKIWDMEIIPQPGEGEIDFHNHPIGSGPFKFKYRKGKEEVCLEANEDYVDGRPSLDRIIFYFQPDREKAWTRILSGKTDTAQEVSPKNYEMMKQLENRFYFDLYPMRFYTILLYNTTDPLFADPSVRLALSHAIDREYIVKKILRGFGVVAVGPMGINTPYHDPKVKPIPHNPHMSLKLLKEAGWSYDGKDHYLTKEGKRFEFTILLFEESQIEKKVAQYLQLCLNEIGIRVRIQALPFRELMRRYVRNNQFQAVITEFKGAYRNVESLKRLWTPDFAKKSVAGGFNHSEVTHLIHNTLNTEGPLEQQELFRKLDALIRSLQPGTFLFHKTAIDVMSKRFKIPLPFSLAHEGIYRIRHASLSRR